jgi:outer membrane protein OmpA-like peptidoglycan-associated protein
MRRFTTCVFLASVTMAAAAAVAMADPAAPDASLGVKAPGLYSMKGKIYTLIQGTSHMPDDVEDDKPAGVIYTEVLNVKDRDFKEGFPGVTDRFEWFGIIYTGRFQIAKAGDYAFRAHSDDGIILWIDGKQVLANDSIHGPQDTRGTANLAAGNHTVKVWYFQGPRYSIALQVFVTAPGGKEKIFSMRDYAGTLAKDLEALGAVATPEGIKIKLDASILFDLDKDVLKPTAQEAIKHFAAVLAAYPEAAVAINGYTSSEGEAAHNQDLSERRAKAVQGALATQVAKTVTLTPKGRGSSNPVADNKTEATRAPNRRVELLVWP